MNEIVTLRFNGLMLEKLVERATKEGVSFRLVKRIKGREAILETDKAGAEKLMLIAERFSLDIRQVDSRGSGEVLRRVRRRWTLPAAIVIVGMMAMGLLGRVWVIDIHMIDGGDPAGIEKALADMSIQPGISLDKSDMDLLQTLLKANCPSYAYVGARKQGVRLLIEATETFPAPDVYDYTATRDIIAKMDALVYSVDVLAGTANVKPGQYVKKGDVLISGTERDDRETTRGVNAMGSVMASAWFRGEASRPLVEDVVVRTGSRRVESEIRLWDYSLPLKKCEGFETEQVEDAFYPIGGIIAPLGILKRTHYETVTQRRIPDMDEVKAEASKEAFDTAMSQSPEGAQLVDRWEDFSVIDNDTLISRAVVEVRLDIAMPGYYIGG